MTKTLPVGTHVHVKPRASQLLPHRSRRGGAGRIVRVVDEAQQIYAVELVHTQRQTVCRRDDLIVHRG